MEHPAAYPPDNPWRAMTLRWQENDRQTLRLRHGKSGTIKLVERRLFDPTPSTPGFTALHVCGLGAGVDEEDRLDHVWVDGEEESIVLRVAFRTQPPLKAMHFTRVRITGDRNNWDIRAENLP
jgi:hypothetical protein